MSMKLRSLATLRCLEVHPSMRWILICGAMKDSGKENPFGLDAFPFTPRRASTPPHLSPYY